MAKRSDVGLIGVGLLGSAIADRLAAQRLVVHGFDTNPAQLATLAARGGVVCEDAGEVVRRCEVVFLSLPTSEIADRVLAHIASVLRTGHCIVDTTTGDPDQMIAMCQSMAKLGVDYVECCVAGSSVQVREGRATLFAGGEQHAIERVQSQLSAVAPQCFRLGLVGSASRFKLVHNLLLGLNRAVLAEGLAFAELLGFSASDAVRILQQTPAASAAMDTKGSKMAARDYTRQARLSQHLKDVRLILSEAERVHASTPLSKLHLHLLERAEQLGFGDVDNSAVIEVFRAAADTSPRPSETELPD